MKHAVLIMAHKNKEQLIRLIRSLACDSFDFFIHPDSEWNLSKEDLSDIEHCAENVYITKKRIHGILDNWSLPQISLNLIDDAVTNEKSTDEKYSYFLLLSGQDYPIKSKEFIADYLMKKYPTPMIDIDSYSTTSWMKNKFNINIWVNKIDDIHNRFASGLRRKIICFPFVIGEKIEKTFLGSPMERLTKKNFSLYGGSAWWILPNEVIIALINHKNKNEIIEIFKRSTTPEETYFQTIIMNSMFSYIKPDTECYSTGDQKCPTYANFITPTKKNCGHPHIIVTEDYDRIINKKQLFARKFDSTIDSNILDLIDKRIM